MPNLYNNKEEINHQSKDLSNVEKPLLDIVTGRKYFERGESTLNIDDKFLINLTSKKRYAESYSIDIVFTLLNKDCA